MRSFIVVAILGLLALGASAWAGVDWQQSYHAALQKAKKEDKLVMVDLYADWCGPCKLLDRDTFGNKDVEQRLSKEFIAVKVNLERSKEAGELAKKFGASAIPHVIFVNSDGKKIADIIGYVSAREFLKELDGVAEKAKTK
ncbi:MAG TPA: thioredoxin family protein [Verrucomicrobiae bacterium]|nr:thioredoxin family protein [Verrucomicrobiae bacterium]